MSRIERPFFPIIYVRGYAMTRDEIVQTTSTPYMGFESGSTKIRQAQDGRVLKFVFESPLVRLMPKGAAVMAWPRDESVSSDDPRWPGLGESVVVTGFSAWSSLDDEWQ